MRDYFNETFEWTENGNKKRKVARNGDRISFSMQMMDAANSGFRTHFADGSPDFTSPHQKGFRFADSDSESRIAANEAYEANRQRLSDAWRKDKPQPPQHFTSLDEARTAAFTAYEANKQRMSDAWRKDKPEQLPKFASVDEARRAADIAYAERSERMRNRWKEKS